MPTHFAPFVVNKPCVLQIYDSGLAVPFHNQIGYTFHGFGFHGKVGMQYINIPKLNKAFKIFCARGGSFIIGSHALVGLSFVNIFGLRCFPASGQCSRGHIFKVNPKFHSIRRRFGNRFINIQFPKSNTALVTLHILA